MITEYFYKFDKQNKVAYKAKSGDTLSFKTLDCFSNLIKTEQDLTTGGNFDFNKTNPATGPVYIENAQVGDVLKVEILKVDVASHGAVTTVDAVGPLYEGEARTRILEVKNGKTIFNGLEIPVNPMVGVIGVAPNSEAIGCGYVGKHGGNMDCKLITAGSIVYLPIQVEGALLQMGDIHAVMADCELCGTGLEIAGEITVKVELIKGKKIEWPVLETQDAWYTISCDLEYTQALIFASKQMQDLVSKTYGFDKTDTYLYLSLEGDVGINQGCQPCPIDIVLRLGVPKRKGLNLL